MTDSIAPTAFGLPDVPGKELDPYLDATARCFARHGLGRTRVTDIAEEVGVSRVTVYRQVGTVEQAARLLLSRELDRLLASLLPILVAADEVDQVIGVIAGAVDFAIEHPVLSKVLRDEPDLVGGFVIVELDVLLKRLLLLAEPVVRRLETLGTGREVDLAVLADWVARVVLTLVVAPPSGPVDAYLRTALGPILR
jgi:AcrR family transcriptional regulator